MSEKNNCILEMTDLRFVSFKYSGSADYDCEHVDTKFDFNFILEKDKADVTIDTTVTSADKLNLKLTTIASFTINNELIENSKDKEEFREFIVKNNTVAIMFPYIRAEISTLTQQPFLKAVVIQPYNITELTKDCIITKK